MNLKNLADWKGLRTKAIWTSPFWVPALGLSIFSAVSWVQGVNELEINFGEHLISSQVALVQIASVEALLKTMNRRDLTKRGKGEAGDFGGSAEYVRISSEISSLYTNGDDLKITNLSAIGKPSEVFSIRGEWDPEDSEVLISFSAGASAVFSLEEGEKIKIRIEPVEEEK